MTATQRHRAIRECRMAAPLLVVMGVVVLLSGGPLGCKQRERTPAERGAQLYARSCSGCHGPYGKGGARTGFRVPPRDLSDPELYARTSDAQLEATIRVGKGQMPAFDKLLSEEEMDLLLLHLHSLPARAQGSHGKR